VKAPSGAFFVGEGNVTVEVFLQKEIGSFHNPGKRVDLNEHLHYFFHNLC
jgi:hypothetical protein